MPASAPPLALLHEFEQRLAAWIEEWEGGVRRQAETAAAEAAARARGELADELNQAVRRLRQAGEPAAIRNVLAEAASAHCGAASVLRLEEGRVRCDAAPFAGLDIALAEAPALAGAVETRDPVTAAATPGELSSALFAGDPQPEGARVALFPVMAGERAEAVLYCRGEARTGALELLAQAAGLALPAAPLPAAAAPAPLIAIEPAAAPAPPDEEPPATPSSPARPAWDELPTAEQQAHLKAQRFARVQVSEMRLFQAEAVHAGRMHRDLYGVLRGPIDGAREKFRAQFLEGCPSMLDYLHVELLRTLANDNVALLGPEYPGPLA